MANMARKEAPGFYVIGIYNVMREGAHWLATGRDFGFAKKFATLADAHLALTGEPMRNDGIKRRRGF